MKIQYVIEQARPAATFWVVSQVDWNNWEGI